MASYVQNPDDLDGLCRTHLGSESKAAWIALVYYAPDARLVSVHCLRVDNLEDGFDVTPDVDRRLKRGDT